MGLIGREIAQTRTYIDPTATEPALNYKETFPISVFDAIRADMNDEDSLTLTDALTKIGIALQNKQNILPAKSANYLMTYGGVAGAVGAVAMSMNIPWAPTEQRNDRIPTEKAVGDLIQKLGLVDEDGNIIDPGTSKIRWSDIIGRPLIYQTLGSNTDGFIHQKGVTDAINGVQAQVDGLLDDVNSKTQTCIDMLADHMADMDNPHAVSLDQIGAASADVVSEHISNFDNPHVVTAEQVGLGECDNTSDMDKPISTATQEALDALLELIQELQDDSLGFVTNVEYDQPSGHLTVTWNSGSSVVLHIPIDGLVDQIKYDSETKELVYIELGGNTVRVDLSDLFIRYIGSVSSNIKVEIIGDQLTGEQTIQAAIVAKSITDTEMGDASVITRVLADEAVTDEKIAESTITTVRYADQSVTTEKIALAAVTTTRLADRSVTAPKLFTSLADNRVLMVGTAGEDPYYGQLNGDMIADGVVENRHLAKNSVSADNIIEKAVTTSKLDDLSVITPKLADLAVTNDKLADDAVDTRNIVDSVELPGTPEIEVRPDTDAADRTIPDTKWVVNHVENYVNQNDNYADRSVDGRVLFTSDVRHRVLAVLRANSDPVWTQIDTEMIGDGEVKETNIADGSVTRYKIADASIYNEHLTTNSVDESNIQESAVTLNKIIPSDNANMVLAAVQESSHPVYSKVTRDMISNYAISAMQIEDQSITLPKIESSDQGNRLLGVVLKGSNPQWMQATTEMLSDGAITLSKLATTPIKGRVLAATIVGDHPEWVKVRTDMIEESAISTDLIADDAVTGDKIAEGAIENDHLADYSITGDKIAEGSIDGSKLFECAYSNRVLAVDSTPYSNPKWLQVTTDMIEDEAVTKDKIFTSNYAYRFLGVTDVGKPPEYLMVTHDFIEDDTITPSKLVWDFTLYGTPEITVDPDADANNKQIPSTRWVRAAFKSMTSDPEWIGSSVSGSVIENFSITGDKLFKPAEGPRLLGVTAENTQVEYLLAESDMIADGAITVNKIMRDITLLGHPKIELSPPATAKTSNGNGHLIADCQWVLDRIAEAELGEFDYDGTAGSSGSATLTDGCITTDLIEDYAVTGEKLFTSSTANRVLGVLTSNSAPVYTQVNAEMMANNSVPMRAIVKSASDYTALLSKTANTAPEWGTITTNYIGSKAITEAKLADGAVTADKISDYTITADKLASEPMIDSARLYSSAVTEDKIADGAVTTDKVAADTIISEQLTADLVLQGHPTVEPDVDIVEKSVRNIMISPNQPTGGSPGDVWIQYI